MRAVVQERAEAGEEQASKGVAVLSIPELSPLRCLLSVNFWLLFSSFCIGADTPLGSWLHKSCVPCRFLDSPQRRASNAQGSQPHAKSLCNSEVYEWDPWWLRSRLLSGWTMLVQCVHAVDAV